LGGDFALEGSDGLFDRCLFGLSQTCLVRLAENRKQENGNVIAVKIVDDSDATALAPVSDRSTSLPNTTGSANA
jgi:hypothetical protein